MALHRMRFLRAVVIAGVCVAWSATGAIASAREPVDPSTLNPPPPDPFNAVCQAQGSQIVCDLAFSDPPLIDEPSGVVCDGTELLISQTRDVVGKRYYDADGNLLVRHFRETFTGDFTNPDTGMVATWTQHDTVIHRTATPGDVASGTTSVSGQVAHVRGPDGQTILIGAGRMLIDESDGEIISLHGPHPFDDYFAFGDTHALDAICDALA